MFLDDGIGEDENDDDAFGDRESDWRATSLDVNSAGHQIKETATDDSAGGRDRQSTVSVPSNLRNSTLCRRVGQRQDIAWSSIHLV